MSEQRIRYQVSVSSDSFTLNEFNRFSAAFRRKLSETRERFKYNQSDLKTIVLLKLNWTLAELEKPHALEAMSAAAPYTVNISKLTLEGDVLSGQIVANTELTTQFLSVFQATAHCCTTIEKVELGILSTTPKHSADRHLIQTWLNESVFPIRFFLSDVRLAPEIGGEESYSLVPLGSFFYFAEPLTLKYSEATAQDFLTAGQSTNRFQLLDGLLEKNRKRVEKFKVADPDKPCGEATHSFFDVETIVARIKRREGAPPADEAIEFLQHLTLYARILLRYASEAMPKMGLQPDDLQPLLQSGRDLQAHLTVWNNKDNAPTTPGQSPIANGLELGVSPRSKLWTPDQLKISARNVYKPIQETSSSPDLRRPTEEEELKRQETARLKALLDQSGLPQRQKTEPPAPARSFTQSGLLTGAISKKPMFSGLNRSQEPVHNALETTFEMPSGYPVLQPSTNKISPAPAPAPTVQASDNDVGPAPQPADVALMEALRLLEERYPDVPLDLLLQNAAKESRDHGPVHTKDDRLQLQGQMPQPAMTGESVQAPLVALGDTDQETAEMMGARSKKTMRSPHPLPIQSHQAQFSAHSHQYDSISTNPSNFQSEY